MSKALVWIGLCVVIPLQIAAGAEATGTGKQGKLEAKVKEPKSEALRELVRGAQWTFKFKSDRLDPFYERELFLRLSKSVSNPAGQATDTKDEDLGRYALFQISQVEQAIADKKFEDAVKLSDSAIRKLEPEAKQDAIQSAVGRLRGYRDQAQEALIRNEAQTAFDALGFRIAGIMWSEDGPRRVILVGEKQSNVVNDRVKDCTIINIETDRVDFRFHYKRRRFEFPRYVGDTK